MSSVNKQIEEGKVFKPKFDDKGLISVIVQSSVSSEILMFAFMNEEALKKTIETGEAYYYSRSRKKLWKKGEKSGMVQKVKEIRVDCDQDSILLIVDMDVEAACHVGFQSCFYRKLEEDGGLKFIKKEKVFEPKDVY